MAKTEEKRRGRQTPTASLVLPYSKTKGQEAIDLYNSTNRTAQEWQELLVYDILSENDEGQWMHTKFGYSVPRRNGKNEVVAIREMYGLKHGETIIHTAHRTTTSHSSWERLCELLSQADIKYESTKQYGLETIRVEGGGRIFFRTRSSKGGLGEGCDLLVIDEAQEYTVDQESALKYIVSSSENPQTLMCGTPPTPVSTGTVFTDFRNKVLAGESFNWGWAEWSVEVMSDIYDRELWYETNPSMGTILSERDVMDEISSDNVDFNIQRLGLWIKYNQKSAISKAEWEQLSCESLPKFRGKLFIGIKYGIDGTNVAVSIAVKTTKNDIFVESYDCRPIRSGNLWIMNFLNSADIEKVVIDGAGNQDILAETMKKAKLKKPVLPTVKEVITAHAMFEQGMEEKSICHKNQPSLTQSVSNCERRSIGTGGGFGYKSLRDDIDVVLLESVVLAYWAAVSSKERKKQSVRY